MLIKVSNKNVLNLSFLNMFALMYVYEKEKMTKGQIELMMNSIVYWYKKVDLKDEDRKWLEYIGSLLDKEEKGELNERKENFKKHGISWLKFHRIPKELYVKFVQKISRFN